MLTRTALAREGGSLDRATLVVAAVVILGAMMSILDATIVNVALDTLALGLTFLTLLPAAMLARSEWARRPRAAIRRPDRDAVPAPEQGPRWQS